MRYAFLVTMSLIPLAANAASGSWSNSAVGVTLQNRGEMASSSRLHPKLHAPVMQSPGNIDSVGWRYQLLTPQPVGLRVKLCNDNNHCIDLDGASGQTRSFYGQSSQLALHFVYYVEGKGVLNPPLRVVSNQVMVNYR